MVKGLKQTQIGFYPVDWLEDKLENVITVLTDFTANGSFASLAQNVKYLDKPDFARLVRLTDIRASFKNDAIYISKEAYNFLAKSKLYGNELLLANVGAYAGYSFLYPTGLLFKGSLGPNMFLIKFNEKLLDPKFAFLLFVSSTILNQLLSKAASSAQPKLNKQNVRECLICYPSDITEQTAISTTLNDADNLISELEKLIAKKKMIKQGAMQELLKPKEKWSRKRLGDISDITKLAGFEYSNYFNSYNAGGEVIVVRGTNITNNKMDLTDVKYIPRSTSNKLQRSKLRKDDLVFAYVGTIGPVFLIDENDKYHLGPNTCKITPRKDLFPRFLFHYFTSSYIKKEIVEFTSIGAQPSLSMFKIRRFKFLLPPISNQIKIAENLSDMDSEIKSLEQNLDKYKMIKQGMMQNLLTGKTRLV